MINNKVKNIHNCEDMIVDKVKIKFVDDTENLIIDSVGLAHPMSSKVKQVKLNYIEDSENVILDSVGVDMSSKAKRNGKVISPMSSQVYQKKKGRFNKRNMKKEGKSRVIMQEGEILFKRGDVISESYEADPPADTAESTGTSQAAIEAKKLIKASTHLTPTVVAPNFNMREKASCQDETIEEEYVIGEASTYESTTYEEKEKKGNASLREVYDVEHGPDLTSDEDSHDMEHGLTSDEEDPYKPESEEDSSSDSDRSNGRGHPGNRAKKGGRRVKKKSVTVGKKGDICVETRVESEADLAHSIGTSRGAREATMDSSVNFTPTKNVLKQSVRELGVQTPTGKREKFSREYHLRVSVAVHSWAIEEKIDLQNIKLNQTHFEDIRRHGVEDLNILRPTNTSQKLYSIWINMQGSENYERYINEDQLHKYPDTCSFHHCGTLPLVLKENCPNLKFKPTLDPEESLDSLKKRCDALQNELERERARSKALLTGMMNDSNAVDLDDEECPDKFSCPFCGIVYRRIDTFKKHIKDNHSGQDCTGEEVKEMIKDKKVTCKYCGKKLAKRTFFKHTPICESKHAIRSPIKDKRSGFCKLCKMVKSNLSMHMETHSTTRKKAKMSEVVKKHTVSLPKAHATVEKLINVEDPKDDQESISKKLDFRDAESKESSQVLFNRL